MSSNSFYIKPLCLGPGLWYLRCLCQELLLFVIRFCQQCSVNRNLSLQVFNPALQLLLLRKCFIYAIFLMEIEFRRDKLCTPRLF